MEKEGFCSDCAAYGNYDGAQFGGTVCRKYGWMIKP